MGKFNKKTIRDVELKNRRVLLRADYNVPVKDGKIEDDYRIRQSLPTIDYILTHEPKSLVIISHLGRPDGKLDKTFSLVPVAQKLANLLKKKVYFATDCVGEEAKKLADNLPDGGILLLENLRFHPGEEQNSPDFAKALVLATQAQLFVQDGFGVVHRAHASTEAITRILPSVAGLLLESEATNISKVVEDPVRPLTAVVGGAKISDKIDVLDRLIDIADCVAAGGALANNFLHAEKVKLGDSLVEPKAYDKAEEILVKARRVEAKRSFNFITPVDAVVAKDVSGRGGTRIVDFGSQTLADIESYPKLPPHRAFNVLEDEKVLDVGPVSAAMIAGAVRMSGTVIWAGTLGVTETRGLAGAQPPFAHGTRVVVDAIIGATNRHANKPYSLVGGGDTVAYVEEQGLVDDFNHVSTGGSASLELIAGHHLPGIDALESK